MLLEIINSKCNGELNNLRLRSAILGKQKRTLALEFSYPVALTHEQKEFIRQVSIANFPTSFELSINFAKDYMDCEIAKKTLHNLLEENFHSLFLRINSNLITAVLVKEEIHLTLTVDEEVGDIANAMDFENKMQQMLNSFTVTKIIFKLDITQSTFDINQTIAEMEARQDLQLQNLLSSPSRTVELDERSEFIGGQIDGTPKYILDIDKPENKATICGKVGKIWSKTLENSTMYKFELRDFTGQIPCVFFAKDGNADRFATVFEGDELLVSGKVELSSYSGLLEFKVFKINKCKIGKQDALPILGKPVNEKYLIIQPVDYFEAIQTKYFAEAEEKTPKAFLGKSFVVFDVETTGIKVLQNKIIEIGAVKVVDGQIVQTFSTLINPECSISVEITALTGITNEMLVGKPTIGQVMCDFFKFCEGSTLVAHNADFDMSFLLYFAKPCGYIFNHEVLDTIAIAKKYYSAAENRRQEPGNFKLSTLSAHLNITNTDAHRALADALATAKVFLKLYA